MSNDKIGKLFISFIPLPKKVLTAWKIYVIEKGSSTTALLKEHIIDVLKKEGKI